MNIPGAPGIDGCSRIEQDFHQANHAGVVDLNAGNAGGALLDRVRQTFQKREVGMHVEPFGLKVGKADKVRFLNTSEASLEESRYYLILSEDLGYGKTGKLLDSLEEVSRLLNSYSKAILDSSSDSWLLTSRIPARGRMSRVQLLYRARGDFKGRSPLASTCRLYGRQA